MRKYIHGWSEKVYTIEDSGRKFVKVTSMEGKITTSLELHRDKLTRFERDLEEFGFVEVFID